MTKAQFWTLNIVGGILAVLLLLNVGLGISNRRLSLQIQKTQAELSGVSAFEKITQNLILRLASASREDKALQNLLSKHKLEVRFQEGK
ncbi:MAG: hypothetical protein ACOY3I_05645 [Verrucomicrobiota bacterium]